VNAPLSASRYLERPRVRHNIPGSRDTAMFSSLEIIIERLKLARVAALVRDLGPYAAIELLLPGGSLIALSLWLYSRHKSGKPLLPSGLGSTVRKLSGLDLLNRRLRPLQQASDVPAAGVAFGG
jgi:hypothetical protein